MVTMLCTCITAVRATQTQRHRLVIINQEFINQLNGRSLFLVESSGIVQGYTIPVEELIFRFTRNIGKPKTVKMKGKPGDGEKWWFLKRVELKSDDVTETDFGFNVLLDRKDYNEVSLVPNTTREVEWKIKIKTDKETDELYMNLFGSNGVQSGFSRLGRITTGYQIQTLTTKTRDLGQPTHNVGQPARHVGHLTRVAIWNRGSSTIYIFQFSMNSSKIFSNKQFVANTTKTMLY
ncbi:uncharacterized protein LOC141909489 isoform X2 [Tubulanus polymorphus]|uniref:uncharacterized protein LOC141909489 isoform X2 n=1 Tax=Tubulanus polymorphus TaxID=672921 RepID=UPI003DA22D65